MSEQKPQKEPIGKLFRGGELYCPDYRGKGDLLAVGGMIARIAPQIPPPEDFLDLEIVECGDRLLAPGFVDQHVHMIGAAGGGGPVSRTREIKIQQILQAGVTTAVGCLGLDVVTRDLKRLLVKARALEEQGITTFIYAGAYVVPSPTLTGSIEGDLVLVSEVVGVKLGLGEPSSTFPGEEPLQRLLTAARRGALLSGKAGIVHIHMGERPGEYYGMIERLLKDTTIPLSQVVFTHSNRSSEVFECVLDFAKRGGLVDMTGVQNPDLLPPIMARERLAKGMRKPSQAVEEMLAAGIAEDQITISSDSNAGGKTPDGTWRYGSILSLWVAFRDLAQSTGNLPLALKMVTLNPARRLGLACRKGTLEEGKDADLLVLTRDLQIAEVYAAGKRMVQGGEPVIRDPYD